jgi:hypothetical protein
MKPAQNESPFCFSCNSRPLQTSPARHWSAEHFSAGLGKTVLRAEQCSALRFCRGLNSCFVVEKTRAKVSGPSTFIVGKGEIVAERRWTLASHEVAGISERA